MTTAMLLTVTQAAERLGLSAPQVRVHCAAGRLAARQFGRAWLIEPAEVERFRAVPRRRGPKGPRVKAG